jgi:hypothetical protein
MRVTYQGPFDSLEVPDAGVVVERGQTVEIPDELAQALIARGDFTEEKTRPRPVKEGGEE